MNSKQIVSLVSWILAVAFLAVVGYGSFKWYFKRPPTTVYQNTYHNTTVMPGANQTISYETKGTKQKTLGFILEYEPQDKKATFGVIKLFW